MFNWRSLFPVGIIIEDESVIYRRQLKQAQERQLEREMLAMAWIDNLFHGEEYRSIFEEDPALLLTLSLTEMVEFKDQIKSMKGKRHDAGKE